MISETSKSLRVYNKLSIEEKENLLKSRKIRADDALDYLSTHSGSLELVIALRNDIRIIKEKNKKDMKFNAPTGGETVAGAGDGEASANALYFKDLDYAIQTWMKPLFMPDLLEVKRLDEKTTSFELLENVIRSDATLGVQSSFHAIKKRLFDQRTVFAAFHTLLPDKPLVIITANTNPNPNPNPSQR
jgi:hypothetical protein